MINMLNQYLLRFGQIERKVNFWLIVKWNPSLIALDSVHPRLICMFVPSLIFELTWHVITLPQKCTSLLCIQIPLQLGLMPMIFHSFISKKLPLPFGQTVNTNIFASHAIDSGQQKQQRQTLPIQDMPAQWSTLDITPTDWLINEVNALGEW